MAVFPRQLKKEKRQKWVQNLFHLRVRLIFVMLLCIFIGLGLPVFILKLLDSENHGNSLDKQCQLEHELRINCLPGVEKNKQNNHMCEEKGCCWHVFRDPVPNCFHSHPTKYTYRWKNKHHGLILTSNFNDTPLGPPALQELQVKIAPFADNHLRVSIFKDSSFETLQRYNYQKAKLNLTLDSFYDVFIGSSPHFYIQLRRKGMKGIPIFNTFYGPLIFSDGYSELTTLLPSFNIYGIGQAPKDNFRHDLKYANTFTLFSKEECKNETHPELYMVAGVHPFYMVLESNGNAHGVLLLSSSPVEIVTSGAPSVTFRSMSNYLDFHVFFGPTPADVIKQLLQFVGKPQMPPYWALGYHSCRDSDNLTAAFEYLNFTASKGIPHDSDCGSSQLLLSAFTINPNLRWYLKEFYDILTLSGKKHILFQPPHIEPKKTFTENSNGIFIKAEISGKPVVGYLPNGKEVIYPDFFNSKEITSWLRMNYQNLMRYVKFDALFLQMNTPINFNLADEEQNCTIDQNDSLSELNRNLSSGTICLTSVHVNDQTHKELHNLYGYKQALTMHSTLQNHSKFRKLRKVIISLSTFIGSGAFGGHLSSAVTASWKTMKSSLIQMLDYSLYGIPFNGVPMCGTHGDIDTDMCTRWLQLAAFQPLMMSYRIDDDELLGTNRRLVTVAASMIQLRYSFLPYLYTLFYRAHVYGETVVRPLFFEFPKTSNVFNIDEQFMWGSGLLVSPVLEASTQKMKAFFPPGCWYDYYTGKKISDSKKGGYKELMAIEYHINLHVRGGHVVPSQEAGLNTKLSRQNSFHLTIALDCLEKLKFEKKIDDERVYAYGELYIDDGESDDAIANSHFLLVNVTVRGRHLNLVPEVDGVKILQSNPISSTLESIQIYGFRETPYQLRVDGQIFDHIFKPSLGIVSLHGLSLDLKSEHDIMWDLDEW